MIIWFEYPDCPFEGKCYNCLDEGSVHEMSLSRETEVIPPIEATPEYNGFLKPCSRYGYDYHELFLSNNVGLKQKTSASASSIAATTSRVISRASFCHSGVKYSFTRNATKWKQAIMFL